MGNASRIVNAIHRMPWAMLPEKLEAIQEFLELRASGVAFTPEQVEARIGNRRDRAPSTGATAVLPLYGVVAHRVGMMTDISGGTAIEAFAQDFRAMVDDPGVARIVLDVDSPGGGVEGVDELSRMIYEARDRKPITAVANATMASAAYWIASAAHEVVAMPSGLVGSIGVYTTHTERSVADEKAGIRRTVVKAGRHKAAASPFEPLSDEDREALQAEVDEVYGMFVEAVARNRGVSASTVRNGYGEGRALRAKKALDAGLVDRIATFDEVIREQASRTPRRGPRASIMEKELDLETA